MAYLEMLVDHDDIAQLNEFRTKWTLIAPAGSTGTYINSKYKILPKP